MRRTGVHALQLLDPSRLALAPVDPATSVALVAVYRAANVAVVHRLVDPCPPGWTVRLWSLDGPAPASLAEVTVGSGPGTRFALLNRLIAAVAPEDRHHALVVSDDDVRIAIGDVGRLVEAGTRLGYDLYQPGHVATTADSWRFVRRRTLTFARQTWFVEQGPLFVLSAAAQRALLPFPEERGMAWGIEARWWAEARRAGLRLGIVDAVGVRHLGAVAAQYDRGEQEIVMAEELRDAGLADLTDIQLDVDRVGVRAALRSRPR